MLPQASKEKLKFVKSLQLKKYRQKHQLFMVEGSKSVLELLNSDYVITDLMATKLFYDDHNTLLKPKIQLVSLVKEATLSKIGTLKSNNSVLAVAKIKPNSNFEVKKEEFVLALDGIKDPGNLGTIIRIADWYGISKIVASEDTVEVYNPKVIASTMGSFLRTKLYYTNLTEYLIRCKTKIYGTFLEGTNLHDINFGKEGIVIIGNESKGISMEIENLVNTKITIPRYGGAESLNAAISTAVICDNIRRH